MPLFHPVRPSAPRPSVRLAAAVALTTVVGCAPPDQREFDPPATASTLTLAPERVVPEKELVVTNLSVVEDPKRTVAAGAADGAWTVGRLAHWAAGRTDPSRFVLGWLRTWERDQTINGRRAAARPDIRRLVINPWLAASGCRVCQPGAGNDCAASDDTCKLDFKKEPFRLLAIVNRIDLRNTAPDEPQHGGEGRFVFGLLGLDEVTGRQDRVLQFTAIFEYELPASDPKKLREWARGWHDLGNKPWGKEYNTALADLTDRWTRDNCKGRPNDSCLNQVRTNEASLDPGRLWELREFRLDAATKRLVPAPLVQTPYHGMNATPALAQLVNDNEAAILAGTFRIPSHLLAASELTPAGAYWYADGIASGDARHKLSLTTCGGCHNAETATRFTHVKPRASGVEAKLSAFMTGRDPATGLPVTAPDPITGLPRSYDDIGRRVEDLRFVLTATDKDLAGKKPKNRPH